MSAQCRHARLLLLAVLLAAAAPAAALDAVRELGQPDFTHFQANRVDGRGLAAPSGVAVDRTRVPNGLWVVDAGNHRALGWRDVAQAAAGAPADVVLGQPDSVSNECNNGGVSARSLCLSFSGFDGLFDRGPGLALDGEGNLWVADRANSRVLGFRRPFDTDAVADVAVGQDGLDQSTPPWERTPPGWGIVPGALATNSGGDLFIVDVNGKRVVEVDRPFAGDTQFDRVYGQSTLDGFDNYGPDEATSLSRIPKVNGVAVDATGRLYVGDSYTDRVLVWDAPLALPGGAGPANHEILQGGPSCGVVCYEQIPKALAVAPNGDLWVSHVVVGRYFGEILGYRSPFGPGGDTTPDRLLATVDGATDPYHATDGQPQFGGGAIALDESGTLWVADFHRVLGFGDPWHGSNKADRVVGQARLDEAGANLVDRDGFSYPATLALDTSVAPPHLYVLDQQNSRVLGWADAERFTNGQPADLVIGQQDRFGTGCNKGGRSLASLCSYGGDYSGLAVDSRGTLWVADFANNRVLGYRAPFLDDTVADRVLGQHGGGSGDCASGLRGLCGPGGVAVDGDRNLYVADTFNNRIVEYDQPLERNAAADHVIGTRNPRPPDCQSLPTCFYQQINHYGIFRIYGGSLAVDPAGRLLVGKEGRLYVFPHPRLPVPLARVLVQMPSASVPLHALATDSSGRIYVAAFQRVQRYRADGAGPDLEVGGTCGLDDRPARVDADDLCAPSGLAVSPAGELFVSDGDWNGPAAHRVVVYDLP